MTLETFRDQLFGKDAIWKKVCLIIVAIWALMALGATLTWFERRYSPWLLASLLAICGFNIHLWRVIMARRSNLNEDAPTSAAPDQPTPNE